MGQYYKQYLKDAEGHERVFCSQNAIYMTRNGIESPDAIGGHVYDWGDPDCWGSCFSGLKLMEHAWIGNDFTNGVLEALWDNPCTLAWVGDYADDKGDYDGRYTEDVYLKVWGDDCIAEGPFGELPTIHRDGFIVNLTRGEYVDLAEYVAAATYKPKWASDGGWCNHPLAMLTAIGNGRGGGDYHGAHMEKVGAWAMDEIMYTQDASRLGGLEKVDAQSIAFREE